MEVALLLKLLKLELNGVSNIDHNPHDFIGAKYIVFPLIEVRSKWAAPCKV